MFKYRGLELANWGFSKSRKWVCIILHIANIKWKIAVSAYAGKSRKRTKGGIKLRCLKKDALALLFSFWLLGWLLEAGYVARMKLLWDTFLSPQDIWIYRRFPSKSWRCMLRAGCQGKHSTQEGRELPNVPGNSVVAGPALCASAPHRLSWQEHSCHLTGRGGQSQPRWKYLGEKGSATKAAGAIFPHQPQRSTHMYPSESWCLVENPGGSSSLKHYLQCACTFMHLNQAMWIWGEEASSPAWQLGAKAAGGLCLGRGTSPAFCTRARMKGQSAPSYLCTTAWERTAACKIRQALPPHFISFSDIQQRSSACQVTTGNGLKQVKSLSTSCVAHLQAASYNAAVQS